MKPQFKLRSLLAAVFVVSVVMAVGLLAYDRYVRQPRAFCLAAESGDTDAILRMLERGVDIPKADSWGRTPLMFAAMNGHIETTRVLVEAGAQVDERAMKGMTPLMWAALTGKQDVVEYLVAQGADVSVQASGGYTAVYYAKGSRNAELIKFLSQQQDAARATTGGSNSR